MIISGNDAEKRTALAVAEQMVTAARTAPKACGVDQIVTLIIDGSDKDELANELRKIAADDEKNAFFGRDAGNVDASHCVVLIGIKDVPVGLPNCGLCGFDNCAELTKAGGKCAFKITDLGIAVGSAVSLAANARVDNRVFYTAGKAALRMNLLGENVSVAYGIPLSTLGKNPTFDRR